MFLGAWVRNSRDRRGWEQGKYFIFLKKQKHGEDPTTLPLLHEGCLQRGLWDRVGRPVLFGSHLQGRWGQATLPSIPLSLSFRGRSLELEEPRRSRPCLKQSPQLSGGVPPCSFTMNFPLQLCGGTWRLALATKDRIRTVGMGRTREEAAHQASECAVSPTLACAHTACVFTPAPCL